MGVCLEHQLLVQPHHLEHQQVLEQIQVSQVEEVCLDLPRLLLEVPQVVLEPLPASLVDFLGPQQVNRQLLEPQTHLELNSSNSNPTKVLDFLVNKIRTNQLLDHLLELQQSLKMGLVTPSSSPPPVQTR